MRLEIWWGNKKGTVTPETLRNWLQEAKTTACAPVITSYHKKLVKTGIKFSDSEISKLLAELSDKRAVHLRPDALKLGRIILLDRLDI